VQSSLGKNTVRFASLFFFSILAAKISSAQGVPAITTQPANQTVTVGQSVTFDVVIANGPCRSFWYVNGAGYYGAFASTISYTIPSTTLAMNGSTVVASLYDCGSTGTNLGNSQTAILTVNPATGAPSITSQPTNQTVTVGQTATFIAGASGAAPLAYQWQNNGANISGAVSASYTTPVTTGAANGSAFQIIASNSAGSVTSSTATLTVNPAAVAPTITAQPANQTVTVGQTATFTAAATGTAPLAYQWQNNGANISGAVSASYTTPVTTSAANGSAFHIIVGNSAGSATSSAATLTVNPTGAPAITQQPQSQTVQAGQSATFTVVISNGPCTSFWYVNGTGHYGAAGSSISYTVPNTTLAMNGWTVAVDLYACGSAGTNYGNSQTATLTVTAATGAPTITTQPANQTVTAGQTATFTVAASGTAPLSYQWQENGANITGATSASYTTPATSSASNGSTFAVLVSNSVGNVTSNTATLTVNAAAVAPTITTQPASQTVSAGQTATFSVAATGTAPLNYQWLENGTAISGATSSTYTTPATTTSYNGDIFQVTVSNSVSSVTSSSATLTIVSAELANVTVTVTTTGQQIPSNFGGISTDFFDGQSTIPNPLFPQLVKNLTFPGQTFNLNLEGDSPSPPNNPPTNAQIATYNHLYTALQNLGVSLEYTMPVTMCATSNPVTYAEPAVSTYLANAPLPGWIGVTLGNEPDGACNGSGGYAGGYSGFLSNWNTFVTDINVLSGASALKFVGPSFGGQQPWVYTSSDLNSFVNGEVSHLTYASQHWYTQNGCTGSPTVAAELSAASAKPPDTNYASYVLNAHTAGTTLRISEMNDIDCGGRSGISNTFAAALWMSDAMFNLASVGTDGVNIFSDEGNYDLLDFPSLSACTINVTSGCNVDPNYYGFQLFQEATQNSAKFLPVSTTTSANVSVWATIDAAGIIRIAVLNKDQTNSGTVGITLAGYGNASLKTLTAPSVTATRGVSYGGQTFDGSTDGTIQGTLSTTAVTPTSGVYTFAIAPTSAALITVSP
jgi:hypothetical protein